MDLAIFNYLNSFAGRREFLDVMIVFKAEYLGWWMIFGLVVFLAASLYFKRDWKRAKQMVFIALVSGLFSRFIITDIIRFFYSRPRPFDLPAEVITKAGVDNIYQLIPHASGGSLPSGHAAFFFAIAAGVFIFYRKWGFLFFLLAFAMGVSRVIAGIHWPSDILGGAVIGILSAYLINYAMLKYKKHSS